MNHRGPLWGAFQLTGAHPWLFQSFIDDMWSRFCGDSLGEFADWLWETTLEEGWAP